MNECAPTSSPARGIAPAGVRIRAATPEERSALGRRSAEITTLRMALRRLL
jgi:hypothetical protein